MVAALTCGLPVYAQPHATYVVGEQVEQKTAGKWQPCTVTQVSPSLKINCNGMTFVITKPESASIRRPLSPADAHPIALLGRVFSECNQLAPTSLHYP
jgi:hypothetical protein